MAREKPPDGPVAEARPAMGLQFFAQLLDRHARLGLDLVETYEDMTDRRMKRVRLTVKGKALRNRILTLME